ncbi:hypothetical protein [Candidatus Chromulinivorax destructor]|uniref:DUF4381 domain-containing protein n=1 Tax=Candidatus Chromulinivorax destructor TaxID=2066483 RepID=A0A345ZAU5_9BACT|nr:hypothetical protein [Candidatus Chromulinivorax destructor]AXK60412.1 hypothetical protein C0J27_01460 [Candidatus Chromulinivorax destructor]
MNENSEQIFDIYDIWYEPLLSQTWFIILLILLLSIFMSCVLYFIYVTFYNKVKVIDPLVIIQNKIAHINSLVIKNEHDSKQAYFEISQIIKEYITYHYKISVIGLTDHELLLWSQAHLSAQQITILEQICAHINQIKFEHQIATTEQVRKNIELVQAFIHSTKEA